MYDINVMYNLLFLLRLVITCIIDPAAFSLNIMSMH